MQIGKTGVGSNLIIDLRVILHGAGTKGIKTAINRIVFLGKIYKMPHNFRLTYFW